MRIFPTFFSKVWLLMAVIMTSLFFSLKIWEKRKVIEWDISLYYSYLPATFIYDDLKLQNRDTVWDEALFFMNVDQQGHTYVKMTSGLAYLYAPFFTAAHWYASNTEAYAANGFTLPYRFALLFSDLFFALVAFWFLGKFLNHWFSEKIAALTAILIFVGTNIGYYTYVSPMSHVYNLALVSMILQWSLCYLGQQKLKYAIGIGLVTGLMVLIRPTNLIALLFPLILLIFKFKKLDHARLFSHLPVALFLAILPWIPQLFYWHHMTGSWLVYSYNEESFFFADPEIWKGLLSYRKGWLVYSPILFFSVMGFTFLFKKEKLVASATLLTLAVALWVTFSWWCWWYGGGFGARPLIEFLPFMALPLAAFLQWLLRQRFYAYIPVLLVMSFLCYLSAFMSMQAYHGIIHHDAMSKELFWKQFLVPHYVPEYDQYTDPPDYSAALKNEE